MPANLLMSKGKRGIENRVSTRVRRLRQGIPVAAAARIVWFKCLQYLKYASDRGNDTAPLEWFVKRIDISCALHNIFLGQ
jgi:hypothetical protein